jgi:hypothetical protein
VSAYGTAMCGCELEGRVPLGDCEAMIDGGSTSVVELVIADEGRLCSFHACLFSLYNRCTVDDQPSCESYCAQRCSSQRSHAPLRSKSIRRSIMQPLPLSRHHPPVVFR